MKIERKKVEKGVENRISMVLILDGNSEHTCVVLGTHEGKKVFSEREKSYLLPPSI